MACINVRNTFAPYKYSVWTPPFTHRTEEQSDPLGGDGAFGDVPVPLGQNRGNGREPLRGRLLALGRGGTLGGVLVALCWHPAAGPRLRHLIAIPVLTVLNLRVLNLLLGFVVIVVIVLHLTRFQSACPALCTGGSGLCLPCLLRRPVLLWTLFKR